MINTVVQHIGLSCSINLGGIYLLCNFMENWAISWEIRIILNKTTMVIKWLNCLVVRHMIFVFFLKAVYLFMCGMFQCNSDSLNAKLFNHLQLDRKTCDSSRIHAVRQWNAFCWYTLFREIAQSQLQNERLLRVSTFPAGLWNPCMENNNKSVRFSFPPPSIFAWLTILSQVCG